MVNKKLREMDHPIFGCQEGNSTELCCKNFENRTELLLQYTQIIVQFWLLLLVMGFSGNIFSISLTCLFAMGHALCQMQNALSINRVIRPGY